MLGLRRALRKISALGVTMCARLTSTLHCALFVSRSVPRRVSACGPFPLLLSSVCVQVHCIRDEPRTRTARSHRHTLITAYQFANSSISEGEFTSIAKAAMDDSSPEYDWLGLEPKAKLLKVETASDYFPHFSQVTTIYFLVHTCRVRSSRPC